MANITINLNIGGKTKTRSIADSPPPIPDIILKRGFADAHPFRDRKLKPKKKKQCTKGHQCGFSCVSPTKTCLADMTTAQLKAHNAAKRAERKAAKAGGGAATPQAETPNEMTTTPKNAVPKIVDSPLTSMKEKGLRTSSDKLAELLNNGNDTWEYLEAVELSQRFNQKELAVLSGEFAKALNFRMEEGLENEMTTTPKNAVPKIVNSPQVSMKEKGLRTSSDKLAELLTNGNDTWEYLESVELSQRFNQKELAVLSGEFAKALNFRMEEQDD